MADRNILLTSLGHVDPDRLNHRYYYHENNGNLSFCDSITSPEAGAKLILSSVKIDEIIVLGDVDTYDPSEDLLSHILSHYTDYDDPDINDMSEFSFLRYRLSQFRDGLDFETLDIIQTVSGEKEEELQKIADKCLIILLEDEYDVKKFDPYIEKLTYEEIRWVKTRIYQSVNPKKKLRILPENKDVKVTFMPMKRDRNSRLVNIDNLTKDIFEESGKTNLYMDMQGMDSADAYTIINLASVFNSNPHHSLSLKRLITVGRDPRNFFNPILDNMDSYNLSRFTDGITSFIMNGNVDIIRAYWTSRNIRNRRIESLIRGMTYVSGGISLCNIDYLEIGIRILKSVFSTDYDETPDGSHKLEFSLFYCLENIIKADYGALLEGNRVSMYELARWAMRKGFYQQALTIIESRFPDEFVSLGLFYYANDEHSKKNMLYSFEKEYYNTPGTSKWTFNDLSHYFIKYYRKNATRDVKDRSKTTEIYIQLRIDQLYRSPKFNYHMQRAFSLLDDDTELLRTILLGYTYMSSLRNTLNHSLKFQLPEVNADEETVLKEIRDNTETISSLKKEVGKYLDDYEKALSHIQERIEKEGEPVIIKISPDEFREYRGREKNPVQSMHSSRHEHVRRHSV